MANYSKFFGALIGGVLSFLTVKFGLPAEWATGDVAAALTTLVASIFVWRFPANVE